MTRRIELVFYRTAGGNEPVREWLGSLPEADRRSIGQDLQRVQFRWPVGMPLVRPMGKGLFEVRTDLADNRIARVMFCFSDGLLTLCMASSRKRRRLPRPI